MTRRAWRQLRTTFLLFLGVFVGGMVAMSAYTLWRLRGEAVANGLGIAAMHSRGFEDFLTQSLRDTLIKELPARESEHGRDTRELAQNARSALKALARIDGELAQLVLTENDAGQRVPDWFVLDIARELPRLLEARDK